MAQNMILWLLDNQASKWFTEWQNADDDIISNNMILLWLDDLASEWFAQWQNADDMLIYIEQYDIVIAR